MLFDTMLFDTLLLLFCFCVRLDKLSAKYCLIIIFLVATEFVAKDFVLGSTATIPVFADKPKL